ncbi:MAG: aryl carrier-like protein, partial [Planctomycetota bacterium]
MEAMSRNTNRRRIIIGDIQGCRGELEELLAEIRFDPTTDELHPVGDLVNRGPDSLGCLRLLRQLGAGGVLGNHDLHLLSRARGDKPEKPRDTLDDVLTAEDRDELLSWLSARPFVRTWSDLYLVHAGLHPDWRDPERMLADEDPVAPGPAATFAVRVRHCDRTGATPPKDDPPPGSPFEPWFHWYRPELHGGRGVAFGHWAQRGLVQLP